MNFNYPYFILPSQLNQQYPMMIISSYGTPQTSANEQHQQSLFAKGQSLPKKEQAEPQPYPTFSNGSQSEQMAVRGSTSAQHSKNTNRENFRKKRQVDSFTQRRNIIPNNVNHILSYIQRKNKSEPIVRKIIEKFGEGSFYSSKKYYSYQAYLKGKLHIHVNRDTLKDISSHLDLDESIYRVQEQLFYNKVTRILICYYLRQIAKLKILSSGRVKLTSKQDHLKAHRDLLQFIESKEDTSTK